MYTITANERSTTTDKKKLQETTPTKPRTAVFYSELFSATTNMGRV